VVSTEKPRKRGTEKARTDLKVGHYRFGQRGTDLKVGQYGGVEL